MSAASSRNSISPASRAAGFSIVELMIAMALGLVVMGGVLSMLASSRRTYESNDQLAKLQANGRFALTQIVRDIREAGYLGCAKAVPFSTALNATSAESPTGLLWDFGKPVFGYESTSATEWTPAIDTKEIPSAAVSASGRSDILVLRLADRNAPVQRIATAMANGGAALTLDDTLGTDPTGPATFTAGGGDWLMVTDCQATAVFQSTGFAAGAVQHAASGSEPGNANADIGYAFQAGAEVFPIATVIYYLRASTAGDSTALWRRVGSNAPEELVEGIDSFQALYGVDTNNDLIVDDYVKANAVTDWNNVVSVRVGMLIRSVDQYGGDVDSIGRGVLDQAVPAFNDRRQRLVFQTTATLRNRAM